MFYRICLKNWLFQKPFNMEDAMEKFALYFMIAYVKFRWFTKPTTIIKSWASELLRISLCFTTKLSLWGARRMGEWCGVQTSTNLSVNRDVFDLTTRSLELVILRNFLFYLMWCLIKVKALGLSSLLSYKLLIFLLLPGKSRTRKHVSQNTPNEREAGTRSMWLKAKYFPYPPATVLRILGLSHVAGFMLGLVRNKIDLGEWIIY